MAKIVDQAVVDLRNFTARALGKIKLIQDVAVVILPEEMSDDFAEAYTSIKKIDIAKEVQLKKQTIINIINGFADIDKTSVAKDSVIVCNGTLIAKDIPEDFNIGLIVNGAVLKHQSAYITIISLNGQCTDIPDGYTLLNSVTVMEIDKNALINMKKKTMIAAVARLYFKDDVTEELLKEKEVIFRAVSKIFAPEKLHGYITSNSSSIGKLLKEGKEEDYWLNKQKSLTNKRNYRW